MDHTQIQELAREIANQTFLHNIWYWLLVIAIFAVVGFFSSWGGSYASKRTTLDIVRHNLDALLSLTLWGTVWGISDIEFLRAL
jgi:hypothetical protein